ncbi:ASTER protein, partial [Tricholaema leucomelas]|nr:ASTER protein [Tricholaema leucomelas]
RQGPGPGAGVTVPGCRYKPPATETNPALEDPTPDYMNLLGMVFSMCGLMLKVWAPRLAPALAPGGGIGEEAKITPGGLSISAVVMSYLQNPQPMSPPW